MQKNLPKDDGLYELAQSHNVASFVSVRSGQEGIHRGCFPGSYMPADLSDAIDQLLAVSRVKTLNIRTFTSEVSKGMPFTYGLRDRSKILELVAAHGKNGLHCILNETVDTRDSGVSGVSLGGLVEFVPDDTPRGVESPDVASLAGSVAQHILRSVYGPGVLIPQQEGVRLEFSVHPYEVGVRQEQVLVWEQEVSRPSSAKPANIWPNRFSRLIGDKTFGLLVADALGCDVPLTTAIARRVSPFSFGRATGVAEVWMRTAPANQAQGKFTTTRGWVDIYDLLASEDPDGDVAAVLSQQGVPATYSGAAISNGHNFLVEGVEGFGDDFMLGVRPPTELPEAVTSAVIESLSALRRRLGVDVSIEWAADSDHVWILQVHVHHTGENAVLVEGEVNSWVPFAPSDGLEVLRELLLANRDVKLGVILTEPVGRTSHVGDLLRATATPARYSS